MFTRQLLFVLAGSLLVAPAAHSASPDHIAVTARLYNAAHVPSAAAEAARAIAARTLVAGGVDIAWRNCDAADTCTLVPAPGELIVRLIRSSEKTNGAIVARALPGPRDSAAFVLGEAFIDNGAGAGVFATIYADRVERMAELTETDAVVLLGRAIAHELGHLLLATNAHSTSGLMRAKWSSRDLQQNQVADWVLSRDDAAAIRRRLQ